MSTNLCPGLIFPLDFSILVLQTTPHLDVVTDIRNSLKCGFGLLLDLEKHFHTGLLRVLRSLLHTLFDESQRQPGSSQTIYSKLNVVTSNSVPMAGQVFRIGMMSRIFQVERPLLSTAGSGANGDSVSRVITRISENLPVRIRTNKPQRS
jgi:hypothetical protein